VQRLGAAVLLDGPNKIVDHLVLEVMLDQPYLVEVGFGDNAPVVPLPLQATGPIATRCGTFEFLASPQGTTLAQIVDGVPQAGSLVRVTGASGETGTIEVMSVSATEVVFSVLVGNGSVLRDYQITATITPDGLRL
jgi:hypothetical protein